MKNFRVTNMVFSGRGIFKRRFTQEEFERIIACGRLHWEVLNDEMSPILQVRIETKGVNVYGRQRCACVSFWTSGSVNIVGVTSRRQAEQVYKLALADIRRVLKRRGGY